MANEIDSEIPHSRQYEKAKIVTLPAGTPGDQFVVFDPRKVAVIEVHSDGQNFTLQTSTIPNETNDITDSSQLWFTKRDNVTADFQSGESTNKGFIGMKMTDLGTLTSDFIYATTQYVEITN